MATGKITTRKCPSCGHHEIGYITEDGIFHAFKPGATVQILDDVPRHGGPKPEPAAAAATVIAPESAMVEHTVWIPEPLRQVKRLRLKYGVRIASHLRGDGVSGAGYELAYRQKLQDLIEKEIFVPLPVILDRFFNAPHLAAGTSKEIADAVFDALDEIQEPVVRMRAWLEEPNDAHLKRLMHPATPQDDAGDASARVDVDQEYEALTLEDFFELL